MKREMISLVVCLLAVLFFASSAHAELFNRGTDSLGNQLIYDSDLNITWYDYTNGEAPWQNQVNWASTLSVDFGGTSYGDWRLPAMNQNGSKPCIGYNCTESELGHLFYTEPNRNLFTNLSALRYWYGTEYTGDECPPMVCAWRFNSFSGYQGPLVKDDDLPGGIAVRDGDVIVPEPISSILFLTGGATLGARNFFRRRKSGCPY